MSMMLDLANFTAASITLRGMDEGNIAMLRSHFLQRVLQVRKTSSLVLWGSG